VTASYTSEHAQADPLRLPDPALLFEARAGRLAKLAEGNPAGDFLLLLSRVADGQRIAVREIPVQPVRAQGEGPPLAAQRVPRDGAWRRMLGVVLSAAKAPGLPAETLDALRLLADSGVSDVESIADAVLAGEVPRERVACAPFVGAALQAWFAALAARLDPAGVPQGRALCPVCGSTPVAGVVQGRDRLRYLSCSLCAAEWHVLRLHCILCGKDDDLAYLGSAEDRGTQAEACGHCRAYVKLFDEERRGAADPAADDVATLALDLVLAEEGWQRAGTNLYLAS
jgi:FdhE protein